MPSGPDLQRFVNKTVPFRFLGRDLRFQLSHGLFSSFDVDDGTRLLLKTVAQRVDLGALGSVLDVGCGVGVLGACIGCHAAGARLVLQDRDALAVAIARANCDANGLRGAEVDCRLAFHGLAESRFDLVLSNIPAKAGAPVLRAFFRHAAGCLSARGTAAVVIVAPLASMARQTIQELGCTLAFSEDSPAYSVFHFSAGSAPTETAAEREDLSPYLRTTARFTHGAREYLLETAHSLPDFDTLGREVDLAMDLLAGDDISGAAGTGGGPAPAPRSVLLWNPGQGHLALSVVSILGPATSVTIASRDSLECAITGRNLARAGAPPRGTWLVSSEAELARAAPPSSVDLMVAVPHPVPRVPWQDDLVRSALHLLRPGGLLLVVSTSTEMHRFLAEARGLSVVTGRKRAGFRAALLRSRAGVP